MDNLKKSTQITIISIISALLMISCNLTSQFPGLAKNIPTSTPEIEVVVPETISAEPTIIISDDSIVISFSESDMLTWMQDFQDSNSDYKLTNPSVKLDDGVCQITATIQSGIISGEVDLRFSVTVDGAGIPVINVEEMKVGGMNLPQSMKDQFSTLVNQSISSSIVEQMGGRTIKSITIDDGKMTIESTN